jgi:hypothetical protein
MRYIDTRLNLISDFYIFFVFLITISTTYNAEEEKKQQQQNPQFLKKYFLLPTKRLGCE